MCRLVNNEKSIRNSGVTSGLTKASTRAGGQNHTEVELPR